MMNLPKALVLVVDDDPVVLDVVSQFLGEVNYDVAVALDAEQALEIASEIQPDIILMDINMPRLTGLEASIIFKHREETKHIPIVIFTSSNSESYKLKAFDIGAKDFINKPIWREDIVKAITHNLYSRTL